MSQPPHPYFAAFHAALSRRGVALSDRLDIDARWIDKNAAHVDAVHLHWPETIWRGRDFDELRGIERALRVSGRLLGLRRFLRSTRAAGVRCIWTVHNLEPHEDVLRWDRYGSHLLASESDLIVSHSGWCADVVRERYRPSAPVAVMPMGELASVCPAPRPRTEVLAGLGLDPARPVVSCLGRLRDYKGLDLACHAIERLKGSVQLVIGGARQTGFDLRSMEDATSRSPYIVVDARRLSDQELADITAASDAVLLPYRNITSSAALLSAIGFGRGVVTSDLPYFREILAPEPDAAMIVPTREADAWAEAITIFLERPNEVRSGAALRLANRYSWDRCVDPVLAAMSNWAREPGGQSGPAAGVLSASR
jgi:glycosyltransferase involved in cell wall biosynthesis